MAVPAIIPRLGNTVESCILVEWKKAVGQTVLEGEALADVETDKAVMEVTSPAAGTLLAQYYAAGDEVPVQVPIALIGEPGEDVSDLSGPDQETGPSESRPERKIVAVGAVPAAGMAGDRDARPSPGDIAVSPRAGRLAARAGLDVRSLTGSGPRGRIIERDVQAALASQPKLSPVARARLADGGYATPARGSGPGGRIMTRDLGPGPAPAMPVQTDGVPADEVEVVRLAGVRKVIAERMLASLLTTAQLTLHASADARRLQALRARFKAGPDSFDLQGVTLNDLILLAVARTLPEHPDLNAHLQGDILTRFRRVHLGAAVDTPRGLMVPVIRSADQKSLRQISQEARRLAAACLEHRIGPDELTGATFTVTNLGGLGIESFTPLLNPPEVAILGVGNIALKPVQAGDDVSFRPYIGLSLTIDHQAVDGAPAARFLQTLSRNLAEIDLLLAG